MDTASSLSHRARSLTSSFIRDVLAVSERADVVSLAGGLPPNDLLAIEAIAAAAADLLGDSATAASALQYGPTNGTAELRAVVARRLGVDADEVVITTGSQQGLDLLARALLDPGDLVVVESPTYLGALQVFRANGAELRAVAGDANGLDTDALERLLRTGARPRFVSIVSEFANPTGATLSTPRRRHLIDLACRYDFVVIDDNPYGELRWSGDRPRSLRELAAESGRSDRIVTLGSASKILAPGLRIGWMVAAQPVRDAVVRFKQCADLHTSTLDQLLVASLLADDVALEAHLDAVRACYRERCATLIGEFERRLGDTIEIARPDGGMFIWVRCVDRSVDTTEWFLRAVEGGVAFVPGAAFSVDNAWSWAFRACFATLDDARLVEAVRRMTEAFPRIRRAKCAVEA